MSARSLSDLSEKMRQIDFAMLSTHTDGEAIASRPMSNNRDVDYDGNSYYFTLESARVVSDIQRSSKVSLAFQGEKGFFVAVEGEAELVLDKDEFAPHWVPDLDQWFEDGIDTDGLMMIRVRAMRIHYWDGEENGEVQA
jgi:general stress protein 26